MKCQITSAGFGLVIAVAVVLATGCASAPYPAEQLAEARARISAAEAIGADSEPQPSLHLKEARDKVAQAQQCMERKEHREATVALQEAQADAELAFALTKANSEKKSAWKAREKAGQAKENNE